MTTSINGLAEHLSMRVRAWAMLIGVITVPGIISLFVVWTGANTLPAIQTRLLAIELQQTHHIAEMNKSAAEQKIILERTLVTLQLICAQGEKTAEGQRKCFGIP